MPINNNDWGPWVTASGTPNVFSLEPGAINYVTATVNGLTTADSFARYMRMVQAPLYQQGIGASRRRAPIQCDYEPDVLPLPG